MVLFVFAHQDDEMAAASRIRFELARGAAITCVFLTDGASRSDSAARNRESLAVLTSLGVPAPDIAFLGSEIPVPDGTLVEHLEVALERLEAELRSVEIERIYCLAWEGGHQDHDASQLVAAAFAKHRGLLDKTFELPLYRGWGRVFRVFSPIERRSWQRRRIPFAEGLRLSMLAWRYPSQRFSWIGLFPEAFVKLVILRRELVRKIDPGRFRSRPHDGALFYEQRFRFPYDRFAAAALPFIASHF